MIDPRQPMSDRRRMLSYGGKFVIFVGVLLFLSTFASAACHFGDFDNFDARGRSMAIRAFGGMALMILGGVLQGIAGARGDVGEMLDESSQGHDEPWSSRPVGDHYDDTDVGSASGTGAPREVIRVRCRQCQALNDEHARFCDQCGGAI